ncbi:MULTISPECIES: alpha/beta fold hydrolase [unclassified Massilia]|uniref:alpha/beta fold hydrolase n=1 Tax=unclassified Massilia TaxID=2609279 RepID=UPI001B81D908|nr:MULTISPECIES: alpha/beta hydrolase [unclassified Massilia]MBQ5940424.1 alpha/beta hydrolase [Massilia sp. AB1]MBQ5965962.1 alpha/beta hydrolase [Massilia sp. ZL223]
MSILLVPGYMADETLWDGMRDRLAPFGPLVHADLRHDSTLEAMARRALLDAPPSFVLIGFSMGGYVAREIVYQAPERVRALVLIATSTRPDSPALRQSKGAVAKAAPSVSFAGLSRTAIATSLHPDQRTNEALIERVRAMGVRLGGEAFRRQSMLERPGDLDRLHAIRCPTLVVAAAQDRLRSLEEAQELHAGIAGSSFKLIENTGHMIPIEAPDALLEAVLPWLAGLADT